MTKSVRRVVTTQGKGRTATVFSDAPVPNVHVFGDPGPVVFDIWKTYETPSRLGAGSEEPAAGPMALIPPKGGHVFRILDIPPDPIGGTDAVTAAALLEKVGARHASTHEGPSTSHGAIMHRTESLDYGIVLEGEITLVLDDGEVHLKTGDVAIQRGSNHGWSNRSSQNCRMAFFMSDAIYPTE